MPTPPSIDAAEFVLIERFGVPLEYELACLQAFLEPDFGVAVAYAPGDLQDPARQVLRITATAGQTFESAAAMEGCILEVVGTSFDLRCTSAVRPAPSRQSGSKSPT